MKRQRTSFLICSAFAAILGLAAARPAAANDGVIFDGRWIDKGSSQVAAYPGSRVHLNFSNSTTVAADLTVANAPENRLYISVIIDHAVPVWTRLNGGLNAHVVLASNLSATIPHEVVIIKESESKFGSLQFANPALDSGGTWVHTTDTRPVVEAIGDSNSNGLCILGPVNPVSVVDPNEVDWQKSSLAWPFLLEKWIGRLAKRDIDVVNITYSGTKTLDQAGIYKLAAPDASTDQFTGYSGHRRVQLAIMFGGVLDTNGGGDPATGSPVTVQNLSPFQAGVYSLISQVLSYNPDARIALPWYLDPYGPSWQLGLSQVRSLFPPRVQSHIFIYPLRDKQYFNACLLSVDGHPSSELHEVWTGELYNYLQRDELIP